MIMRYLIERGTNIGSKVAETFMSKGDMKYIVMNALAKKPMHGYQLINNIKDAFLGLYSPSPGTIYPTLQMLEGQGLIKGKGKGGRKIYKLTGRGVKFLKENKAEITKITESIKTSEYLPQIKKIASDLQEIAKETMSLTINKSKEDIKNAEVNVKKTREILADAIKKIREAWKE